MFKKCILPMNTIWNLGRNNSKYITNFFDTNNLLSLLPIFHAFIKMYLWNPNPKHGNRTAKKISAAFHFYSYELELLKCSADTFSQI